jgi:DNA-binding transcriptional MocR family regulator
MDLATQLGPWSTGSGPLHRKLAAALAAAIERGDVAAGERLPAERVLARTLAVSRSTVVAAYDHLRAEGWLESRQGSGSRVRWAAPVGRSRPVPGLGDTSGDVIFRRLIEGPGTTISLAAAILRGSPSVVEAAGTFSTSELTEMVSTSGYVPLGLPALRREIAALHTRAGLPTTEAQVMVTTGAQQAISLAAGLLVDRGDAVVVDNPSFSGTLDALRVSGATLVAVPTDDDGTDVDALARAVERTSPAAIYVMPSFHNPTGVQLTESRRRRLARVAATTGVPLIEDNTLEQTALAGTPPLPAVATYEPDAPILTVGSLSKVLWGGLRVGWIRANETMIGRLAHCKAVHDLGSPVFPQAIAARILPRLEAIGAERRAQLTTHLDRAERLLHEHVPTWTWRRPVGGLALWVKLPAGDGNEFAQVALRYGVEVVPGTTMSPVAPAGTTRSPVAPAGTTRSPVVPAGTTRSPVAPSPGAGAGTAGTEPTFSDHLRLALIEPPLLDEGIARLGRAWAAYAPSESPAPEVRVIV